MLSILIPAYNVEEYIERCLESIKNQVYKDFEVIIVNDGSTDGTLPKIIDFCKKDSRFKYFTKENGGQMSAYLLGLDYARGDIIGFVDPDDTIDANMYQTMITKMSELNLDIVCCGFKRFDTKTNKIIKAFYKVNFDRENFEAVALQESNYPKR